MYWLNQDAQMKRSLQTSKTGFFQMNLTGMFSQIEFCPTINRMWWTCSIGRLFTSVHIVFYFFELNLIKHIFRPKLISPCKIKYNVTDMLHSYTSSMGHARIVFLGISVNKQSITNTLILPHNKIYAFTSNMKSKEKCFWYLQQSLDLDTFLLKTYHQWRNMSAKTMLLWKFLPQYSQH